MDKKSHKNIIYYIGYVTPNIVSIKYMNILKKTLEKKYLTLIPIDEKKKKKETLRKYEPT